MASGLAEGRGKLTAAGGLPLELFDPESDLREEHNLLGEKKELAASLEKELRAWLAEPRRRFDAIK